MPERPKTSAPGNARRHFARVDIATFSDSFFAAGICSQHVDWLVHKFPTHLPVEGRIAIYDFILSRCLVNYKSCIVAMARFAFNRLASVASMQDSHRFHVRFLYEKKELTTTRPRATTNFLFRFQKQFAPCIFSDRVEYFGSQRAARVSPSGNAAALYVQSGLSAG